MLPLEAIARANARLGFRAEPHCHPLVCKRKRIFCKKIDIETNKK